MDPKRNPTSTVTLTIVLKKHSNKITLMVPCYNHKSEHPQPSSKKPLLAVNGS